MRSGGRGGVPRAGEAARQFRAELLLLLSSSQDPSALSAAVGGAVEVYAGVDSARLWIQPQSPADEHPVASGRGRAAAGDRTGPRGQRRALRLTDFGSGLVCACGHEWVGDTVRAGEDGSVWTDRAVHPVADPPCPHAWIRSAALLPIDPAAPGSGCLEILDRHPARLGPGLLALLAELCWCTGVALDRLRAEAELREANLRFAQTMRGGGVGLWDWDLRTDRVRFSREWKAQIGHLEDEVEDSFEEWHRRVHPEDLPATMLAVETAISQRLEDYHVEFRLRHKDGSWRWIAARGAVLVGQDGEPVRFVGSHVDITTRRTLQVEHVVESHLSGLGRMAASLAHEINDPLGSTLYNLESLARDFPGLSAARTGTHEEVESRIADALAGARQIHSLARTVGLCAQTEQQRLDPLDLDEVVAAALKVCQPELQYRAEVQVQLGSPPPVLAVGGRLCQVFLHLLVKAGQAGGVGGAARHQVRVRTGGEAKAAIVEIHLGGISTEAEHSAPEEPGAGPGLMTCRQILEEFGGTLSVQRDGSGTTFQIRLPAHESATPGGTQVGTPDESWTAPPSRILIVDDNPLIRKALTRILRGHSVVEAAGADAARDLLVHDRQFDVILCDVMMPGLVGTDFHAWLCDFSPRLAERVVFVTGGAFTPKTAAYLAATERLYVPKPFEAEDIKSAVDTVLRASAGGSE